MDHFTAFSSSPGIKNGSVRSYNENEVRQGIYLSPWLLRSQRAGIQRFWKSRGKRQRKYRALYKKQWGQFKQYSTAGPSPETGSYENLVSYRSVFGKRK